MVCATLRPTGHPLHASGMRLRTDLRAEQVTLMGFGKHCKGAGELVTPTAFETSAGSGLNAIQRVPDAGHRAGAGSGAWDSLVRNPTDLNLTQPISIEKLFCT